MRVLFVSGELIAGSLAHKLKREGCDIKLFIEDKSRKECFDGILKKTDDWKKELDWVGKDGLIVFDDVGYGKEQAELRKQGYAVFGGTEESDKLEQDRAFGQKILRECGIETVEGMNFDSCEEAIHFVRENPGEWVVKQNDHQSTMCYVGQDPTGQDVVSVLQKYSKSSQAISSIHLQKKVNGVEIAIGGFFNGESWVGPVSYVVEHKRLCNDDLGPMTGEMGSLAWYDENRNLKLYKESLAKLEKYLKKIKYK